MHAFDMVTGMPRGPIFYFINTNTLIKMNNEYFQGQTVKGQLAGAYCGGLPHILYFTVY